MFNVGMGRWDDCTLKYLNLDIYHNRYCIDGQRTSIQEGRIGDTQCQSPQVSEGEGHQRRTTTQIAVLHGGRLAGIRKMETYTRCGSSQSNLSTAPHC